jgi:hypothetical protein
MLDEGRLGEAGPDDSAEGGVDDWGCLDCCAGTEPVRVKSGVTEFER